MTHLVEETSTALNNLARENKICITWIPSHSGYRGNEKADQLAKQGANSDSQPEREVGVPYQEGCNVLNELIKKEKREAWTSSRGLRWTKELLDRFTDGWSKKTLHLDKRKTKQILGLFTGHYNLRCYTHKIKEDRNLCRWCGEKEETPSHFLCKCPNLAGYRQK